MSGNKVKSLKYNLIGGGLPLSCKVFDGKIIPTFYGESLNITCPSNVWYAAFMRNMNRFYVFSALEIFTADEFEDYVGDFRRIGSDTANIPFAIEYKISTGSVIYVVYNNRYTLNDYRGRDLCNSTCNIGGGVYKNGRVFGVDLSDNCKLRWSGEGGFEDWEEKIDGAGWLYSNVELGDIYRLYVLKGNIVALKKYGVSLISAYGTPENFKEIISVATPPPYKECATVCGNKLYFYTSDGLYSFTAAGAEKVPVKLAEDFVSPFSSMTYGESVFFAGTHKKLGRTVIFVYDTKEKSSYFIDIPATALCAAGSPYVFNSEGLVILKKGLAFRYESEGFADFSKRNKTLKSLYVGSEKEVDVMVQTDKGSRIFKGVKGELKTHMCGRFFKVVVEGTDGEIDELTANVEYY